MSTLNLRVASVNDGAELMCRATNPWLSGGALEDKRIISVACEYIYIEFIVNVKFLNIMYSSIG